MTSRGVMRLPDRIDEAAIGRALAASRRAGRISPQPLKHIRSQDQAEAVQWEANFAFGDEPVGYVVTATTLGKQKRLGCNGPIFGRAFASTVAPSGSSITLPAGVLGAGYGCAFTLGLPYPQPGTPIGLESLKPLIVGCATTLDILGRRVSGDVPLNTWTATADYALHVVSIVSPLRSDWLTVEPPAGEVSLAIDGHRLVTDAGGDVGSPLESVVWLAEALQARGRFLNAFDRVFVSASTDLLQVLPGQRLERLVGGVSDVQADLI